jgi:uncharacterized NAD(P)/FAD-binding protein YdhS
MAERPTVAIVGAGFSGLLTALRLLAAPDGPCVRLIERRGPFAQGVAYSTHDADHLLNVRASNMSAFAEDPGHFLAWLASRGHQGTGNLFVPRKLYGDYLRDMIQGAIGHADAGRLILEADAAVALERDGAGWSVRMAMGRSIAADAVVLAIGNQNPSAPPGASAQALASPAYVADPWSLDADTSPEAGDVLLLGTGLTMVDVAMRLHRLRPGLRMRAISRRGLLPRVHLAEGPAPLDGPPPCDTSPAGLIRRLRVASRARDWRAGVDGLRPHVHAIWSAWSLADRRRFLRHARPWWDVHRHRMAPPVAAKLAGLIANKRLTVTAGRIRSIDTAPEGLDVRWRRKGAEVEVRSSAALLVNCAGPNGDPAASSDPLVIDLLQSGNARGDACGLGLDVDDHTRLIDARGVVHETLFAVGPITQGALWEITSVPDIRLQAARCAAQAMRVVLFGGDKG